MMVDGWEMIQRHDIHQHENIQWVPKISVSLGLEKSQNFPGIFSFPEVLSLFGIPATVITLAVSLRSSAAPSLSPAKQTSP
jgi:hypothetical protein